LCNFIKFIIVYFYLLCRHSIRRCAGHVIKSRRRASHSPPRRSKNIYGRRLSRWLPAAIIGPAPTLSFRVGPPIVGRCAIFSHGLELLTMARVAPITEFLRTKKFPLLTHWPGKGISPTWFCAWESVHINKAVPQCVWNELQNILLLMQN
jgi:hypothetical protein